MYKILATIVFILSVIASCFIYMGGNHIGEIRSIGGQSLQEAYYYGLGSVYKGLSFFVLTTGIFFSSFLYRFQKLGKKQQHQCNFLPLVSHLKIKTLIDKESNSIDREENKKNKQKLTFLLSKPQRILLIIIIIATTSYIAYESTKYIHFQNKIKTDIEDAIKAEELYMTVEDYKIYKKLTPRQQDKAKEICTSKNKTMKEAFAELLNDINSNK